MSLRPDIGSYAARILIVDDELNNRQVLKVMLAPEGYVLQTAASGEEALAAVAQQAPDLILLDVMMPEMNGYQVAARIKGDPATKSIPVIMITALDDRDTKMLGLNAGAEEFLAKPVDRAELCVRVKNLLRLKAYGDYYDRYSQALEGEVVSRTADLAERTQQAAILTEQAALLDLAHDAIVVRDLQNRILFWSRGAQAMYGWLRQDALGRDEGVLLGSEHSQPSEEIQDELLRLGQWEGEATHYRRDGTSLVVASRWALQRDAEGEPVRILTINNDITDRKKAESELLLLSQRLALATVVAKVGVWEWDLVSGRLTWDATMFEIYQLPPSGALSYEQWSATLHPEDLPAVEATLGRAVDEGVEVSLEFRVIRPDGSIRNVSAVARGVLGAQGEVARVIGVNKDMTVSREAERVLEQNRNDQLRFKDDFLSHVSHELRSPLTAIKQFTSILLGGVAGALNEEQRQYQEIVLRNILQLQAMIDDLLEVTRLETGKVTIEAESVSILDAVKDTLDTFEGIARVKGVALSCELPSDLPSAYADPTRLRQILIILFDNAIKFTPGGGAVRIRARLRSDDAPLLELEVSDTGCGINPKLSERIFERLYQVSEPVPESRQGLGLGLYICKELVTRQGGQIWAQRLPKGSLFAFTLPVFSLVSLIAPLFKSDSWPAKSVALVMVESSLLGAWPSKEFQEAWSQEARGLLQRCLLPDLDVLLPRTSHGAQGERFFVAAFADEKGAAILANRMRKQFERLPLLKQAGLVLSVSYSMLQPVPPEIGDSMETIVANMAGHLESSITAKAVAAAVYHA